MIQRRKHVSQRRGGVYIAGGIVPKLGAAFATSSFRRRFEDKGRFSHYLAAIPTYVGGHMAMGWAADDASLRETPAETIAERYRAAGSFATRYWTPDVHKAAFALPRFIAEAVEKAP